jgi:hypothetical protein
MAVVPDESEKAMTERDEDVIKKRAYALWESEGRPEGRHDEHWGKAYRELIDADNTAVQGEPDTASQGGASQADAPQGEPEANAPPVDKPSKTKPAKKSAPPVSILEGGAAGNPAAKRKKKTV